MGIFLGKVIIFLNLFLKISLGTFIDCSKPLERYTPLQVRITIYKYVDQPFEMVILVSNENILSLNKKWSAYLYKNENILLQN